MASRHGHGAAAAIVALLCALPAAAGATATAGRLVVMLEESPSYRVRAQAALSLGRIAEAETVPALVGALDDRHAAVRAAAAQALGRIGSPAAIDGLARLAGDGDEDPAVRAQARLALAQISDAAARRTASAR